MSTLARNALAAATAVLLSVSVAACSPDRDSDVAGTDAATPDTTGTPASQPAPPAANADPAAPMGQPELPGGCDSDAAQAHVGQEATDAVVEQARIDSGAETVRVLAPGDAATMDFRPERLNIDLDDDNVIQALRCG